MLILLDGGGQEEALARDFKAEGYAYCAIQAK